MSPSGKAPVFGIGIPRFESWHLRFKGTIVIAKAVILAAGKGTRMKSDLPKVLHTLRGKPLLTHVIDNIRESGISDITVVVGYMGDSVIKAAGTGVSCAWQKDQLGTGHAVLMAEESVCPFSGAVLIACGDAPLISPESFSRLTKALETDSVKGAVLTMMRQDPHGYGRIIRRSGDVREIIEEKDADGEQRLINEVNTGTYVFDSKLLFEALKKIGNKNAQNEYYLPDVVRYITDSGSKVKGIILDDPSEGSGVNSPEELAQLENRLASKGN